MIDGVGVSFTELIQIHKLNFLLLNFKNVFSSRWTVVGLSNDERIIWFKR